MAITVKIEKNNRANGYGKVFHFIIFNFATLFGTRAMKQYPGEDRCKLCLWKKKIQLLIIIERSFFTRKQKKKIFYEVLK